MKVLLVQRKNIIGKVLLILVLLLAAFFPAKYINSIYGYLPGLGFLSLMLLSALYFLNIRRHIRFEAESSDAVCQRGESVKVSLKVVNGSVLMCPKARVYLFVSDFFGGDDSSIPTTFAMDGRSEAEFPLDIKMDHIGVYTAGVKMLQIYDLPGIFSITIRGGRSFQITVLPKECLSEDIYLDDKQLTESQNARKGTVSDGFDYTGVRQYALGDSMKRIHWKLSAHSSEYMTKITESSRKSDMTVVIDFVAPPLERGLLPDIYDCLIETALSFVEQALRKDVEYSLLFFGRDRDICRAIPKGKQDYQSLIPLMPVIYTKPDPDILDGAGILEKESHISNRSANIILCTSRVTDQLLQELIMIKQQQRNPALYYILPPGVKGRELEAHRETLRVLDDYGIFYDLIPAEASL